MNDFSETYREGKTGETMISNWLKRKGSHVLPIYEIAENQYKGPALYCSNGETLIAPDMAVFNNKGVTFIEAKHKTAFAWYRKFGIWTTGIDFHHFEQYKKFQETVKSKVWILFLHRGGTAKDSPESPSGLFGASLDKLVITENHRSDKHGRTGMIYWDKDSLKKLAEYSDVC